MIAGAAADRLAESPPEVLDHSQMVRDGFTSLAGAFEGLQRQWHPDLAQPVQQLREHAEAVQPDREPLEQQSEIQRFFSQAGDVLDRMTVAQPRPS